MCRSDSFRMDCCERKCFRALVCDSQPFLRGAPKGTTQHTSTVNPSCFSDLKQIFLLCHSLPTWTEIRFTTHSEHMSSRVWNRLEEVLSFRFFTSLVIMWFLFRFVLLWTKWSGGAHAQSSLARKCVLTLRCGVGRFSRALGSESLGQHQKRHPPWAVWAARFNTPVGCSKIKSWVLSP